MKIWVVHELLLKVRHKDADTVRVVLTCLFQVDVVLIEVESLGLLLLASTLLLGLTPQFFEALLHEGYCAMGWDRTLLVNRPLAALHVLDMLVTECLQRLHVGQVRLQLLNDRDDVDE